MYRSLGPREQTPGRVSSVEREECWGPEDLDTFSSFSVLHLSCTQSPGVFAVGEQEPQKQRMSQKQRNQKTDDRRSRGKTTTPHVSGPGRNVALMLPRVSEAAFAYFRMITNKGSRKKKKKARRTASKHSEHQG